LSELLRVRGKGSECQIRRTEGKKEGKILQLTHPRIDSCDVRM